MADLKASVEISARDRFSGPAAKIGGAAGKLEGRIGVDKKDCSPHTRGCTGIRSPRAAMADIAAVFHWPLSEMKDMPLTEL